MQPSKACIGTVMNAVMQVRHMPFLVLCTGAGTKANHKQLGNTDNMKGQHHQAAACHEYSTEFMQVLT